MSWESCEEKPRQSRSRAAGIMSERPGCLPSVSSDRTPHATLSARSAWPNRQLPWRRGPSAPPLSIGIHLLTCKSL